MRTGTLRGLMSGLLIAYILVMFVVTFVPEMESSIDSANVTNSITATLIDMSEWLIPTVIMVLAFLAVLSIGAVRRARNRRRG